MAGAVQERGTFRGIALTLLALALLAERSAARSFPVRFLILAILFRAEAIARRFVARSTATLIAEAIEAGCPDIPDLACLDLACLDEPSGVHYGATDAVLLALRLRILAAVLGMLADVEDDCADRYQATADRSPPNAAPHLPVILIFRLSAARRWPRPNDTS